MLWLLCVPRLKDAHADEVGYHPVAPVVLFQGQPLSPEQKQALGGWRELVCLCQPLKALLRKKRHASLPRGQDQGGNPLGRRDLADHLDARYQLGLRQASENEWVHLKTSL